ncbi:MAG: VWA domain-containing protein [Candidatus Poribacteria bacterium]|nr:VWA domain-containing protein [Candidatus Poribacteria bacterium]
MKNISRRTVKSITRNALIISMILHVFLLITLFYFSVRNQSLLSFQDKLDATIETVPKQLPAKIPKKAPILQQHTKTVYKTAKPLAEVEAIKPHIAFQPRLTPPSPIVSEQPRLEQTNTAPDVKVNVSTALNELRQVENGLSKTEAAEPTIGSSFGSKRSSMLGVQRTPAPATLDITGTTDTDDDIPTLPDRQEKRRLYLQEKRPPLPYIPFGTVMKNLANEIVETSEGGPIDVVFVIDASSSMGDEIKAVVEHLAEMVDVYKSSDIDYALGLTYFFAVGIKSQEQENYIKVCQLTQNLSEYRQNLYAIDPSGDENALDAIAQTVNEMKFRATSKKHLILVTDEPFTSLEGLTVLDSINLCREFGIFVNVLGLPSKQQQLLASETNGKWHPIPEDPKKRQARQRQARRQRRPNTLQKKASAQKQALRQAEWQDIQKLGKRLLQNAGNAPMDIVLFIDGSKSMEDKLPQFLQQLDIWVRDWDNALIDYQIGIVRFRTRASVDIVNVFNPPQSLDQIHKIVELPCQEDENLLHAITEGLRRIKLRPDAQTHLILVTDEPVSKNSPSAGVIQFLEEKQAVVSIIGTFDDFQEEVTIKTGGVWVPIPEGHTTNHKHW